MASNQDCKSKLEYRELSLDHVKTTLNKSTKILCDNLCPDNILLTLISDEALTPDDVTKIEKKDTNTEKVKALLDILARSPVSSYEAFMRALKKERLDLYNEVKAIEKEKHDTSKFNLARCQKELIDIYQLKMGQVTLLPWFEEDDPRDLDDIYVSLEIENRGEVLATTEDLVTVKMRNGKLARRIFVTGTVGSGKSTLLAKLAYVWSCRNPSSPLYKYDLLFILSLREIQKGCSIIDAIFEQILAKDTKVSKVNLKTFISSNPNVLFLIDGFDEYFVENGEIDLLLKFETFRETLVIVSSRPNKHLGKSQSFYVPVTITGFSDENVKLYLSKFFYNNSELSDGLSTKLHQTDNLRSLSHIPIMLLLMCMLWKYSQPDSQSLPSTQSELYAEFIKFLWRRFCHKYNSESQDDDSINQFLIKLGETAFNGLMPQADMCQEKLQFCDTDFLVSEYLEQGCQVGLLTKKRAIRSKLTVSSVVTFLHKSFQEYCASCYWASLPDDQFGRVLQRIDTANLVKTKFEILRFLCGTFNKHYAVQTIQHVIKVFLSDDDFDTLLGHLHLTGHIKYILTLLYECNFPSGFVDLTESLRSFLSRLHMLRIHDREVTLYWPLFIKSPLASTTLNQVKAFCLIQYETELNVTIEALTHMTSVTTLEIEFEMNPHYSAIGMGRLGLCIGRLKNLSHLFLKCTRVYECQPVPVCTSLDMTPILQSISTNVNFQLKCIQFGIKQYAFECDGDILCRILASQTQLRSLSLHGIKLSNGNMKSILDEIKPSLCVLDIHEMNVGKDITCIKHIIPNLEYLTLKQTALQEADIFTLGEFLPNAKNLSYLNLSGNSVKKAVCTLGCVIPQLETLDLEDAHLEEDDISTLAEFIKEATCMSYLNLSVNKFDRAGGMRLCESLKSCSNLERLWLINIDLRKEDTNALRENLKKLNIPQLNFLNRNM